MSSLKICRIIHFHKFVGWKLSNLNILLLAIAQYWDLVTINDDLLL